MFSNNDLVPQFVDIVVFFCCRLPLKSKSRANRKTLYLMQLEKVIHKLNLLIIRSCLSLARCPLQHSQKRLQFKYLSKAEQM